MNYQKKEKMIELHLGFIKNKIYLIQCNCIDELIDLINPLKHQKFIWLCCYSNDEDLKQKILITKNITSIINHIKNNPPLKSNQILLQACDSYQDANWVALTMREPNPKCYGN